MPATLVSGRRHEIPQPSMWLVGALVRALELDGPAAICDDDAVAVGERRVVIRSELLVIQRRRPREHHGALSSIMTLMTILRPVVSITIPCGGYPYARRRALRWRTFGDASTVGGQGDPHAVPARCHSDGARSTTAGLRWLGRDGDHERTIEALMASPSWDAVEGPPDRVAGARKARPDRHYEEPDRDHTESDHLQVMESGHLGVEIAPHVDAEQPATEEQREGTDLPKPAAQTMRDDVGELPMAAQLLPEIVREHAHLRRARQHQGGDPAIGSPDRRPESQLAHDGAAAVQAEESLAVAELEVPFEIHPFVFEHCAPTEPALVFGHLAQLSPDELAVPQQAGAAGVPGVADGRRGNGESESRRADPEPEPGRITLDRRQ